VNETPSRNRSHDSRIQFYGGTGLLVQFDETQTVSARKAVIALNQQLLALNLRGVESITPSYVSLLVIYDPFIISGRYLASVLTKLLEDPSAESSSKEHDLKSTSWRLPTLFVEANDEDALALQDEVGLTWSHIIETFCRASYRVNALGFLPGFTYLGDLPTELHCRRLAIPRVRIPSSSVAIAGQQAGIYPMDSPGGWRVLGRLPFSIFDQKRPSPAVFSPNDQITFIPASKRLFSELARAAEKGELNLDRFKQ